MSEIFWYEVTGPGLTAELQAPDAGTACQLVASYSQQAFHERSAPPGGILMMSDGEPHGVDELVAKAVERDPDTHAHAEGFVAQFVPDG